MQPPLCSWRTVDIPAFTANMFQPKPCSIPFTMIASWTTGEEDSQRTCLMMGMSFHPSIPSSFQQAPNCFDCRMRTTRSAKGDFSGALRVDPFRHGRGIGGALHSIQFNRSTRVEPIPEWSQVGASEPRRRMVMRRLTSSNNPRYTPNATSKGLEGRNPTQLTFPEYTLGYPGSIYLFAATATSQLSGTSATTTVEVGLCLTRVAHAGVMIVSIIRYLR